MADHDPNATTHAHAAPTTPSTGRHVHHAEMPVEHPERHEHTDVSVRGIWITVGAILVTALIVHVLVYFVFFAYERARKVEDEAQRRSAITDVVSGPPEEVPRLQGIQNFHPDTPSVDMDEMRLENRRIITGYAKTPEGRVRIPVERAMEITLEKNLFPARSGGAAAATQPAATTQAAAAATQPAGGNHAGH